MTLDLESTPAPIFETVAQFNGLEDIFNSLTFEAQLLLSLFTFIFQLSNCIFFNPNKLLSKKFFIKSKSFFEEKDTLYTFSVSGFNT